VRKVTLFTGQWADLPFESLCEKVSSWGYDGLEIACWGDHLNVREAATNETYVNRRREILDYYHLRCWAIGAHLTGQCVGDVWDERLDNFVPDTIKGNAVAIRNWAIEEMRYTAQAAKNMGCSVVTGFMGSPLWKYWYSFPQTTDRMVEEAYHTIYELWTPIFDEFDRNGIRFALEVHPTEIAFDFYTTRKLFDIFSDRETLGLNFDPSHLLWQGVSPHLFLREFSSRIYHVHVKDVAITQDGKTGILGSHLVFGDARRGWNFRSPGHGHVDFEEIIRALNDMHYQGPLSVEWEDSGMEREFGAKDALDFVRTVDFEPSSFSFDDALKG
jgi:sugar phosphate isomerase/epimerase